MEPNERQRPLEDGDAPDGEAGAGALERVRQAGEEFLAAGDEAIRRALSGDSREFLRSVRQTGGQ